LLYIAHAIFSKVPSLLFVLVYCFAYHYHCLVSVSLFSVFSSGVMFRVVKEGNYSQRAALILITRFLSGICTFMPGCTQTQQTKRSPTLPSHTNSNSFNHSLAHLLTRKLIPPTIDSKTAKNWDKKTKGGFQWNGSVLTPIAITPFSSPPVGGDTCSFSSPNTFLLSFSFGH
jgi:hypothetical protein